MAEKIKVHLSVTRPGPFGGSMITKSLCNRSRLLADGMNLTGEPEEVTCTFCRRLIEAGRVPKQARHTD